MSLFNNRAYHLPQIWFLWKICHPVCWPRTSSCNILVSMFLLPFDNFCLQNSSILYGIMQSISVCHYNIIHIIFIIYQSMLDLYTRVTKFGGGVYWNHHVRLSVRLSSAFGFPALNCFFFTHIIMKLHMQTPHESRMCSIDFEVKRSKVKATMHKLLKMVSGA